MYARLVDLAERLLDRALDAIWDVTLPMSSRCPVCAFWRGVLLGMLSTLFLVWTAP